MVIILKRELHSMSINVKRLKGRGSPFNEATPHRKRFPLHCYGDVMDGRGDGFKRLNLRRSIDHVCKFS
jgi:hypothetical protein